MTKSNSPAYFTVVRFATIESFIAQATDVLVVFC